MRQTLQCTKCRHNHILLVVNVADRGAIADNSFATRFFSGEAMTNIQEHIEGWRIAAVPNAARTQLVAAGIVSAYICKSCGFTEFYTLDPGQIPVDGVWVKELIGPEPEGPYR